MVLIGEYLFAFLETFQLQTAIGTKSVRRSAINTTLQPNKTDSMQDGPIKTLVAMQLAISKTQHYEMFVRPSWNRLQFDPQTSCVVADLFIACHPDACHVVDKDCIEIGSNNTIQEVLTTRAEHELLCLYAPVPERENETYRFAHSLNFLEMKPFTNILDLDYYDCILRSDADAIFFPGLLSVAPTGDGWIGSGYSGTPLSNHLIDHFTRRFLPQLGEPLRPHNVTPSMQSTFYIHKSKFREFVSVLLLATRTLFEKAFTNETCTEISQLEITKSFYPNETADGINFCRWADWHQGVSSLYGTRVAVDHVLDNVTVTTSLDAMSTNLDRYNISTTIQAHLIQLKRIIIYTLDRKVTNICTHPVDTLDQVGEEAGGPTKGLTDVMEQVYMDREKATKDTLYYVADIVLEYFNSTKCSEKQPEQQSRR